jgi:hypothetical protein
MLAMQPRERKFCNSRRLVSHLLLLVLLPYDSSARQGGFSSLLASYVSTRLLMMPPSARLAMGQANSLKNDCQKQSTDNFYWEPELDECDYRLATRIFELIAGGEAASLWLPKLDQERKIEPLIQVLNKNSDRLGGLQVTTSSWPKSPATKLDLSWKGESTELLDNGKKDTDETKIQTSIQGTEKWVEGILCGLSLCPYTYSMKRAAVGLETVGVAEGPIVIRHSGKTQKTARSPAAVLAQAFWLGVQELAESSEEKTSTLLIVAPFFYDDQFLEFVETFDKLLEPSVQATGAEAIVGRALFHPTYDSDLIGHDQVLPGHALPAKMVEGFLDRYLAEDESTDNKKKPDLTSIAKANDAVRWTPHATINLLRRSQVSLPVFASAMSCNFNSDRSSDLRLLIDPAVTSCPKGRGCLVEQTTKLDLRSQCSTNPKIRQSTRKQVKLYYLKLQLYKIKDKSKVPRCLKLFRQWHTTVTLL